jgi:hypothetical protein
LFSTGHWREVISQGALGGEGEEAAARHEREVDLVIEVSISTFDVVSII